LEAGGPYLPYGGGRESRRTAGFARSVAGNPLAVTQPEREQADHDDIRSTVRPSERPPEEDAERGDEGEGHGPLGNPASDEETLRHRQQERASRGGPPAGADD
jgi:hypothetical protein